MANDTSALMREIARISAAREREVTLLEARQRRIDYAIAQAIAMLRRRPELDA